MKNKKQGNQDNPVHRQYLELRDVVSGRRNISALSVFLTTFLMGYERKLIGKDTLQYPYRLLGKVYAHCTVQLTALGGQSADSQPILVHSSVPQVPIVASHPLPQHRK
jgi:hypothetical protein